MVLHWTAIHLQNGPSLDCSSYGVWTTVHMECSGLSLDYSSVHMVLHWTALQFMECMMDCSSYGVHMVLHWTAVHNGVQFIWSAVQFIWFSTGLQYIWTAVYNMDRLLHLVLHRTADGLQFISSFMRVHYQVLIMTLAVDRYTLLKVQHTVT